MKRLLTTLVASAALITAIPAVASAHDEDNRGYYSSGGDWSRNNGGGYNNFRQEFQHLYENVQHGVSDRSYSRYEARQFYWAINSLRRRLDYFRNNDGYLSRRETQDLQYRIQRLHAQMHEAHENGHAERDYGYSNGDGYNNGGGYNNGYGDQGRDDQDRYNDGYSNR